jgi:O-antigen ligase
MNHFLSRPFNNLRIWNIQRYLFIVIYCSVLGLLAFRGVTNAGLIFLFLPAIVKFKSAYRHALDNDLLKQMRLLFLVLAMPFLAILITQFFRQDWLFKAYDGPARFLLAIPVLVYLAYKQIDFSRILSLAAGPALMLTIPVVFAHPEIVARWEGRFATLNADPAQFGTYVLVLTAFCLFSIDQSTFRRYNGLALQMSGLAAGIYLLIGSGTRGSWLAVPVLLLIWLILNGRKLPKGILVSALLAGFVSIVLVYLLHPPFLDRLNSGFEELSSWLNRSKTETPTGFRLTMWQMSWELFKHQPFLGYGDGGFANEMNQAWMIAVSTDEPRTILLHNGPHNKLLANLNRSGLLGGLSVLGLFFIPLYLFWKNRVNPHCAHACHLGIAFIACLMVCSLSSEVLTMKFTASFYGMVIAGLFAQIISKQRVCKTGGGFSYSPS